MKRLLIILLFFTVVGYSQNQQKIDSINSTIKKDKVTNNWKQLIKDYLFFGDLYYKEREDSQALPIYLKIDSISKTHHFIDESTILAKIHRAKVSRSTFTHDGTENANTLLEQALLEAKKITCNDCINNAYKELAYTKGLMGDYDDAKKFTDSAFTYYVSKKNHKNVSWLYNVYINYYYAVDSLQKAKQKHSERLQYFRNHTDSLELAKTLSSFADFYRKKSNDCDSAIRYLHEAKTIYESTKNTNTRHYLYLIEDLALCHAENNDFKKAYEFYKQAYNLRKTIVRESNNNITRKLEAKYQNNLKEKEIALLHSQNKITKKQKIYQRDLLLGGLIFMTTFGIFFYIQYKNRQKTAEKLKELNVAKSNFFANITHEFRTPLTLIQSPIDEELDKKNLSLTQRNKFNLIKRNSTRLLNLVDQLLLLSKIESKALNLQTQKVNIKELIFAISSAFEFGFKQKKIDFTINLNKIQLGYVDIDFIEKIISNLLSNALKYTKQNGHIIIEAATKDDKLKLKVSNSNNCLSEKQLRNIFKKFYQIDSTQEGYGIGLTLVRELVEAHKGNIKVDCKNDVITFIVTLPINKSVYKPNEIGKKIETVSFTENQDNYDNQEGFNKDTKEISSSKQPILLIVEDNLDMRRFIKSLFINEYTIIEAENGKIGIEQALQHIPDIIISDVMMPKLNGFQLLDTLRNDDKTSHIPIILLTAKIEDEDRLKGIKSGADDYIVKPFKPKILKAKVETLLNNREKIKLHYNHEVNLKPALLSSNSSEEQFFNKLQTVIDKKIQDPSFNVDVFSQKLGMSRMQLHRKLKATLGVSASEFLRTERLKAARHLLQTSDLTVSEIAYSVGFNDANYFSKSFKKLFKISPSDFKLKN